MNVSKIRELIERPEFFDTPLARLVREEIQREDKPWQRPNVQYVDALAIIAELDARRKPVAAPAPKKRKRTMMDDIEGL